VQTAENMGTNLQPGQKVLTPDGNRLIERINGEQVTVKLNEGELKVYHPNQLEDDAAAG